MIDHYDTTNRNLTIMATGNRAIMKSQNICDTVESPLDDVCNKTDLRTEEGMMDTKTKDSFLSKAINQRKPKLHKDKRGNLGKHFIFILTILLVEYSVTVNLPYY